ncbi:hypothetical protein OF83DRAFT_1161548 [Amylostereum chailletii]|nr:hypothetical protein OF83DRAFT_1161548 [Amylostereum chailletii]
MDGTPLNIVYLPFLNPLSVPPPPNDPSASDPSVPIVIDNGASNLRFGFANATSPQCQPNAVAKYKERKHGRQLLLFGDAIESESGARGQAKTPWEGDVLLNFDAMENALDYVFVRLGINTPTVNHPVLMTERLASPLHSRALTSELMFELYSVPSLTYAVDSVMSFYHNNHPPAPSPFTSDGLVVSFNTASTSVVPILNGKGIMSQARRIPWGAQQSNEYLLKLIQLKYPTFSTRVTNIQTSWMLQSFCEVAPDYLGLLRRLRDPAQLRAIERVVQFPFDKRGEVGKREWQNLLQAEGLSDEAMLDQVIKKLEGDLKKQRKKEAEGDDVLEEPSFPLVDVPDAELDEEGVKEKRKQKLMKAGFEARVRARREKEKEREEREADEKREEEDRERDLQGWAGKLRREQEDIIGRIKERIRRKVALSDRKSAVAQARMKNIASLAADERVSKKRRKGGGEDLFGADDADWAIYRKINTAAASSDEEDDLAQLQLVEQKLLAHDPTFDIAQTHAALSSQRSALLAAFRPLYEDGDVEGAARIHLSTERWRVCETWFTPSMAGIDSAGLGEVLQNFLNAFPYDERGRLVKNVFLTGAPSQLPGMSERLRATLRPILPVEMPLEIVRAADPVLDAWRGMADFARTDEFGRVGVSKAQYEEWGGERIKRWWGGNWNASVVR